MVYYSVMTMSVVFSQCVIVCGDIKWLYGNVYLVIVVESDTLTETSMTGIPVEVFLKCIDEEEPLLTFSDDVVDLIFCYYSRDFFDVVAGTVTVITSTVLSYQ